MAITKQADSQIKELSAGVFEVYMGVGYSGVLVYFNYTTKDVEDAVKVEIMGIKDGDTINYNQQEGADYVQSKVRYFRNTDENGFIPLSTAENHNSVVIKFSFVDVDKLPVVSAGVVTVDAIPLTANR